MKCRRAADASAGQLDESWSGHSVRSEGRAEPCRHPGARGVARPGGIRDATGIAKRTG